MKRIKSFQETIRLSFERLLIANFGQRYIRTVFVRKTIDDYLPKMISVVKKVVYTHAFSLLY